MAMLWIDKIVNGDDDDGDGVTLHIRHSPIKDLPVSP